MKSIALLQWIGLLLLSISLKSVAQTENLYFEHLSPNPLPYILVWSIYQDQEGFMWFGTYYGLVKYDGATTTIWKADSTDMDHVLRSSRIYDMHDDRQGNLWFPTQGGGLHQLNKRTGKVKVYPIDSLQANGWEVSKSIFEDEQGMFWLSCGLGMAHFDPTYIPPTGDGLWIPTPPAFSQPIRPSWGNNRPFIAGIVANSQPGAPLAYSEDPSSPFYAAAYEVYTFSQSLTDEQTTIAKYWNDSPVTYNVPGHATHILTQILLSKRGNLADAAVAYAKHGIAMNDGVISCFKTKYQYNLIRPVSYIRNVIQPDWNPLLTTPPHPEYPSAHATVTAAVVEVLKSLFGTKYSFTDRSYKDLFGARTYASFDAYGEEAALSRIYGAYTTVFPVKSVSRKAKR